MSWISVFIILVCVLAAINGYRRGFTKTVVSMISFMVIILLVAILNPLLGNMVYQYTDLDEKIEQYCMSTLESRLELEELGRNEQIELIEKFSLPEMIKDDMLENNNNVIYTLLNATEFFGYIAAYLTKIIINTIIFLVSVFLAWILVKIIGTCLVGVAQLPVIGFFNRICGFGLGFVKGILGVWMIFLVIMLLSGTDAGAFLIQQIQQDEVANLVYQQNPLIWLLVLFLLA